MQGNVWKVPVSQGQSVEEGDLVTIIEAMKMENEITAHKSGVIAELPISEGDLVRNGDVLAVIKDARVSARAWVAQPDEAEVVAALLVEFRDHTGQTWPSANAFLASVERLFEDPGAEFLLATPDDDSPPAGVLQLRFRFSVWRAAPDAWLEDLFVRADARRAGVGDALVALAIETAPPAGPSASSSTPTRTTRRRSRSTSETASRRGRRAAPAATFSSAARSIDRATSAQIGARPLKVRAVATDMCARACG